MTRIISLHLFTYVLVRVADVDTVPEMLLAGTFGLVWCSPSSGWSLILRRTVHEILEGWYVENGHMWPYVLATYFLSPLIVCGFS